MDTQEQYHGIENCWETEENQYDCTPLNKVSAEVVKGGWNHPFPREKFIIWQAIPTGQFYLPSLAKTGKVWACKKFTSFPQRVDILGLFKLQSPIIFCWIVDRNMPYV